MMREVLTLESLARLGSDGAAALLLVRQDAGTDGHDDAVLDAWLAADPENAEAWTRACAAWADFDEPDSDAVLRELRDEALGRPPRRRRWGLAMAASVAAVVATGGALLMNRPDGDDPIPGGRVVAAAASTGTLTTAKGEHRTFALADASTVTLNTDSRVEVALRPGGERRLELIRGQAYFKVAPDKARPFVVAVRGRTVTALGTEFDVRAEGTAMWVVLVDGRVGVSRMGGPPVIMRAGQQLRADARGFTVSPADLDAIGDWRRGVVTFRETSLKDAAAELNRYADRQLVVSDPRVAAMTVSGAFRTDDAARFGRTLETILPVRIVPGADGRLVIARASNRRVRISD